jgi:hypothetical protein
VANYLIQVHKKLLSAVNMAYVSIAETLYLTIISTTTGFLDVDRTLITRFILRSIMEADRSYI